MTSMSFDSVALRGHTGALRDSVGVIDRGISQPYGGAKWSKGE